MKKKDNLFCKKKRTTENKRNTEQRTREQTLLKDKKIRGKDTKPFKRYEEGITNPLQRKKEE